MARHDDFSHLPFASRTLFESPLVQIGATRCPPWHPSFSKPGPIQRHAFYLGGSPVLVRRRGRADFLADRSSVSFHNAGDELERIACGFDERAGDRSQWFAFRDEALAEALGPTHRGSDTELLEAPFSFDHAPCPPEAYLLQRTLVTRLFSGACDALEAEESALALLHAVLGGAAPRPARRDAPTSRRHRRIVRDAKELVVADPASRASLRDVAEAVGTSPFHLARVFRAETGWSLHGFRTQLRARLAADAILAGADDLTDLSLRLGFCSHSHFSNVFRRVFGRSPSELRALPSAEA